MDKINGYEFDSLPKKHEGGVEKCPECGEEITGSSGYRFSRDDGERHLDIYKCKKCGKETIMDSTTVKKKPAQGDKI